jgi:hypothetical protein
MRLPFSSSEASLSRTDGYQQRCGLSILDQEYGKGWMLVKVQHLGTFIRWMSVRISRLHNFNCS